MSLPPLAERLSVIPQLTESLSGLLASLNITPAATLSHPVAPTCEEHALHLAQCPILSKGIPAKNLFVKSKVTGSLFLIVANAATPVNMNHLRKELGLKNRDQLRFAEEELLWSKLRCVPGGCNPFALMHDTAGEVTLLLEQALLAQPDTILIFHPMNNEASWGIRAKDFSTFLGSINHEPKLMEHLAPLEQ